MGSILLVDDSRVVREVLKVYLIPRGVELTEAADGVEALAMIQRSVPDVVIADLRMPRLDGAELCQALRNHPRTLGIPVVILSSNLTDESAARCLNAGAAGVLRKPVDPKRLLAELERVSPSFRGAAAP
ncbi:MAG: response regulator [Myxococcales bacterium]